MNNTYLEDNSHIWDERSENADHLDDPKVREIAEAEGYSWGHPLEEQIQGQISAGFVIAGFYEDRGCALLDKYINTSMATKAVKC